MKRKFKTRGGFLLILGLIIFQFGLLATLHQTDLMDYILNVLPDTLLVELMGVLLQLLGGFLIVAGFTSLVSDIIAIELENEMRNLGDEISSRVDKMVSNMIASQRLNISSQTPQTARICRFCATQLGNEDVFCPTCGKSQK